MDPAKEQVIEAVRQASTGNRLACERAYELSREMNIPLRDIGAVCNELKIKIIACQLGCF